MEAWVDSIWEKMVAKMTGAGEKAKEADVIPYFGRGSHWDGAPFEGNAWGTNGFWPAMMWQMYHATGDERYAEDAHRVQTKLKGELDRYIDLHHDVGFQYLLSFGAEYGLDEENIEAKNNALHAASLLAGRYNLNGFIRAWNGEGREGWAIVDCLMNLSLLYWASRQLDDPRFTMIAKKHADTSIEHFLREDGSCNHIVIFDAYTGEVLNKPGGQGFGPGSSWSRGQAWAP